MNQNRSRAKVDLNKIQSQKFNDPSNFASMIYVSRNIGEMKMNSLSPNVVEKDLPMFEQNSGRDALPSPSLSGINRINSATTLYIETVSNKNNEDKNNDTIGNTLEEEKKYEQSPFEVRMRPIIPVESCK